uniref:Retrotransposable element Tf2 n=1 Tax=Cajanus cajan TaxID=3821 RepID=A0A151TKV6_CAJCA|nr:Retrotransposable element Tf2 [Cajanus cajan]
MNLASLAYLTLSKKYFSNKTLLNQSQSISTPLLQPAKCTFGVGILRFKGRIFLPQDAELKRVVLEEGHKSRLSIHPGMTKMYQDLKKTFWWSGMKREIAEYVAACLTCQKAKVEHQKPSGLMQQIEILEWKWDSITMDFIMGLPRSARNSDAIWVIVDRLTKCAHFLPVNIKWSLEKLTQLYVREIVQLHGVPSSIISDRDPRFTSRFWQNHLGSWEEVLPLVEFTYNNSFHASIGMAPFEALYGRRCRTPLCWYQDGESVVVGPELILQTTKIVKMIQEKMKTAQSRQKSYADKRRKPLEFVGPYQIKQRVGLVAYQLALPPSLSNLHDVFHVSQLRKYVHDPSHVVELDNVQVKENLTFEKLPVAVVDHKLKELRGKSIALVKVLWDAATGEATWEVEQQCRERYPFLFPSKYVFGDENFCCWGGCEALLFPFPSSALTHNTLYSHFAEFSPSTLCFFVWIQVPLHTRPPESLLEVLVHLSHTRMYAKSALVAFLQHSSLQPNIMR